MSYREKRQQRFESLLYLLITAFIIISGRCFDYTGGLISEYDVNGHAYYVTEYLFFCSDDAIVISGMSLLFLIPFLLRCFLFNKRYSLFESVYPS